MKKSVFVVDDNETNLTMAEELLSEHYRVISLPSAAKLFRALKKIKPDLILLDVAMPEVSGFEVIKRLKANEAYTGIPVIFLTALNDSYNEALGIDLGAVDFITKPYSKSVLLNRIKNHLNIDELIRERTTQLSRNMEQLTKRTEQLIQLKNGIVFTLADVIESRDSSTGGHIERTEEYIKILISAMMEMEPYSDEMRKWDIDSVVMSAHLHDLGKIVIPDSILNKPGRPDGRRV
jgi:putative two-component system response regulator